MSFPRRAQWVAWEVLGGRAVLFDEQSCSVHLLNETASLVWGLLDGARDVDGILAALEAAGHAPVRDEVELLLADLNRRGLLVTP